MTDGTEAAAPATNEQPQAAAVEQATPNEGIRDVDAAPENTEQLKPEGQEQPVQEEGETEAKRLSRAQRYQRKISALAGVVERTETRVQQLERENEELKKAKVTDAAPNPADFPGGEYDPGYLAKLATFETLKAVRPILDERDQRDAKDRQSKAETTIAAKRNESAAKAREHIADFDATIHSFLEEGGELAPHIRAAIDASGEKAALIAYNIAKDPDLADRLNAMSPNEALLEIGELRAKASLPERKTKTNAPAPLTPLRGGAAPTVDVHALAKNDDATAYIEERRKKRA